MRVLVTGGSGFTGKHMIGHLAQFGHEVYLLKSNLINYDMMIGEIQKFKPDAVIHLAGISSIRHKNAGDIYNINIVGTRNLLAALESCSHQISCVLIASSAYVYGNISGVLLKESNKLVPGNDYAISKYAMELMANLWNERLPIVTVRPFNYTGIGQSTDFIIPKIVQHFRNREDSISLGNTMLFREYGDVRDVIEIYRNFIEKPPIGQTLNICTSKPYRLHDVIDICSTITGHKIKVEINQKFVRAHEPKKLIGDDTNLLNAIPNLQRKTLENTLSWMLS